VPSLFLVPAGTAGNYIGNGGGIWASALAAIIGVKTYETTTSCSSDPPGWPAAVTLDEQLAVAFNRIGSPEWLSAFGKLNQMLDNVLWYVLCECTGASTPAQPPFPPPPSGAPTPGPPLLTPSSRLCVQATPPITSAVADPETSLGALDVSPQLLPYLGTRSVITDVRGFNTVAYVAPNPMPAYARVVADFYPGSVQGVNFWVRSGGVYGTAGALSVFNSAPGASLHQDSGLQPVPAGDRWAITLAAQSGPGVTGPANVCVEIYGTANPTGLNCCPPDPELMGLLQQIVGTLTPLQRYRQPFAYVTGAAHSGLTGTGSVAIPRCLGIDVTVTAYPSTNYVSGGNPPYIYDLGWISVSEVGGMIQEKRLSQQHYTWLPEYMALADHFNYFLKPGVTITATELYAEP
jgi:hypothetical protein